MPTIQSHNTGGGGRGRGRGAHVATSLSEINVVPLVDVMLVLLIIFMVTAPMMQQGLQVNLPQASKARPIQAQPIYITVPADFARSRVVQINKDEVRIELLGERIRQAFLTRDDKSVFIRADAAVSMQDFWDVTEKLKDAGVDKVGMMSRPRERR